jgi:enamine deaminase RidA (YjgF/YER057c/UK114 family)
MTTNQAVSHNPATVCQVANAFRSIYQPPCEADGFTRLLSISGPFGVATDGNWARLRRSCEQAMDNVEALLGAGRMTTAQIVKITYYVTRATDFPTLVEIRRKRWSWEPAPSVTAIAVSGLARPEYLIEIEALAVGGAS